MKNFDQFNHLIYASEKVSWKINDILPKNYELSFSKPFFSPSMTGENKLDFLNEEQKTTLNQIWAASYLNIFAFVEEYITIFAMSLARESTFEQVEKLRAYIRFSEEEVKHQMLFRRFIDKFNRNFNKPCQFLSDAKYVASAILSNTRICVLLLTYHLEIITQSHFLSNFKESQTDLDPKFTEILKAHWQEESQHAQIDLIKLSQEVQQNSEQEFFGAIEEYFTVLESFSKLLYSQAQMNLEAMQKIYPHDENLNLASLQNKFLSVQHQSYMKCFIIEGMNTPLFIDEIKKLSTYAAHLILEKQTDLEKIHASEVL